MMRASIWFVTGAGGISEPLPTMTARMGEFYPVAPGPRTGLWWRPMLRRGEVAPDFPVGGRTLYQILDERSAVVFFYPKAFTPG